MPDMHVLLVIDIKTAMCCSPIRSSAWAQALAALVHDANKQLPRQKGAQLAAQRKQTLMRLQRMRKRDAKQAGHSTKHDEDSDEEQPMFELPLPHEVTLKALSLLDPVSLARCQCVCRCVFMQAGIA
jgi:hypothetical protein